ncbi:MAG: TetR/AcrR family transcriptional regulator [Proteocatella sp.]|jgi:AcrR family transcriptional regulator|nr:TetR/AcrR family transcriptional regulator [Proteocatella sp.]MBP7908195.1 TetR/AcrR family transcriptional regulator [Proteocatella sp.]MBP7913313.1 TetR/AcrR family transcriptional regulator [Proteocatella sp.]MBP9966220.1 TetR/AcrR family transcriptional regulator [Proteocatella sp.]NCB71375.1 TetR/AcrR family transcriptional regulator [Clostridia bacterium]
MPKIVDVQEKKQEIYRSATQVFLDKGYNNTTLLDIAKLCKMGRSTIYQYFKNKEEIFYEVSISFFSELVSNLDSIMLEESMSSTEKIKKMLSVFIFDSKADSQRFFQLAKVLMFLKENNSVFENKFKFFYLSVQDMFFQVVESGIYNNEIKQCDAESMSIAIFGLAQSIILHTYVDTSRDNQKYFESICLMIDGIKA